MLSIWFAAINAIQLTLNLSNVKTREIDIYSLYVFIGLLFLLNGFTGYYLMRSLLKMYKLKKEDEDFQEKIAGIKDYNIVEHKY